MSGHTAGPWVARCDSEASAEWEVVKPHDPLCPSDHDPVWYVATCHDSADGASAEANARLIASAPELLEALIEIYDQCDGYVPETSKATWSKARAAIAKATGDTP